ncbi:hypothetical protein [Kribbella sp. DT2]|uniref:hypothetical protein n=1 Tax=Kribbella sp. DT2 TaxID=3393427 RepID=UPI003CF5F647
MSTREAVEWRQPGDGTSSPPRVSAAGHFFFGLLCLATALAGPALLGFAFWIDNADVDGKRWLIVLIAAVLTVFFGWMSAAWWRGSVRARRDTKVLDAAGSPATAEILSVRSRSWHDEDGVELGLRVSGDGFAPFETTWHWRKDRDFVVGGRLDVLVEPSTRLFEVRT